MRGLSCAAADKEEELFDIVDDQNNVIGQERRSVVHAQGLKHRAVYCFVFNSRGELLLQQRSPRSSRLALHLFLISQCFKDPDISQNQLGVVKKGNMHTRSSEVLWVHPPSRKKIGPLQWDLSIAEHLEPGEEYRQVIFTHRTILTAVHFAEAEEICRH